MIITSTGFFNTGSSAITGMLQEFSEIESSGDVNEIRLLYDSDCIGDLEYNLIDTPHRHNTSNAVKRFKKFVDFNTNPLLNHHYEEIFNNKFKTLSYDYINKICDTIYPGFYYGDSYNRGKFYWFLNRCYQKVLRTFFYNKKITKYFTPDLFSKKELCYRGTYSEEKFLKETKNYVSSLLNEYNKKKTEYILIDQFLPPTNIDRYLRYIPDDQKTKVFVVERDPRDLYFTAKYFTRSGVVPTDNVNTFCDWYLWTRGQASKKAKSKDVMYVQFEDLIYNYDGMRKKICKFVGIDIKSDCAQKTHFDPAKSVNNTQVWKRFKNINKDELKTIEKKLAEYCYIFPTDGIQPDFSKLNMFDC